MAAAPRKEKKKKESVLLILSYRRGEQPRRLGILKKKPGWAIPGRSDRFGDTDRKEKGRERRRHYLLISIWKERGSAEREKKKNGHFLNLWTDEKKKREEGGLLSLLAGQPEKTSRKKRRDTVPGAYLILKGGREGAQHPFVMERGGGP